MFPAAHTAPLEEKYSARPLTSFLALPSSPLSPLSGPAVEGRLLFALRTAVRISELSLVNWEQGNGKLVRFSLSLRDRRDKGVVSVEANSRKWSLDE